MERSDYAHDDTGNLVLLEHVNLMTPDQRLPTAFYVSGLGLTRDRYLMTGVTNMWINIGRSQIHLPHGDAQRLRGHVALVVGRRQPLIARLRAVQPLLDGTAFGWTERADRVALTCPWGNRYDCLDPDAYQVDAPWSGIDLGIAYVQLVVPVSCAPRLPLFTTTCSMRPSRSAIATVRSRRYLPVWEIVSLILGNCLRCEFVL
ncbi:hypothetical protein [Paraburkholderia sp. BL6665CI2N2]|uniref:hypothetical protein n=1 Tax=Paraburkholderia sp. BL6665CI2N2 TaxID=1938806 RepID=UPI00106576EC|nr:hypothetical protein [Paraburkholderia sp. BL6665CI2N2]